MISLAKNLHSNPKLVETKLVKTPSLSGLQLVYNTEGLLICQLCNMGVQMNQIYGHVTTAKIVQKFAVCDNHSRKCDKDITKTVVAELKKLLKVDNLPLLTKPLEKRPPIEGLKVIEDLFFICDYGGCTSGFGSDDSLRRHYSDAHSGPGKPKKKDRRKGHCQTLYINPPTYFEVEITPPSTSAHTFDLNTFLHNRKIDMLSEQHLQHIPTIPQLLPPVFVELGFHTFIKSLDQSLIPGYMNYAGDLFSQLQKLVIQCFKDDCLKLGPAHNSIREGIMEAPP